MIVLADIGGTNIRLAVQDEQTPHSELDAIESLPCRDFASVEQALASYCERRRIRPEALLLAVAAGMHGDEVTITNNHWQFQGVSAARACGASRYMLINDFCAQALAHSDLLAADGALARGGARQIIRQGTPRLQTPLLVSGPGTGLGVAAIMPVGDDVAVIEGEGGHVSFASRHADELAVLDVLQNQWGHVSAERFVSGPGLEAIYHVMTGEAGKTAAEIGAAAITADGAARDAVALMQRAFATALANAALTFGAGSGIVIAGGIMPKLIELLPTSGFFERLGDHGRRSQFLHDLPLYLSVDPYAGLSGAAVAAKTAHLAHRWRPVA
jgi:glucokinase